MKACTMEIILNDELVLTGSNGHASLDHMNQEPVPAYRNYNGKSLR